MDNGRKKWAVLASYCGVTAMCQMLWLNLAPLATTLRTIYQVGEMEISALLVAFPLLYVLLSVHAGGIIDRHGARHAILFGSVISALFSVLRIAPGSYAVLAVGQLGIACGQPYIINAISKLLAQWFPSEQNTLATGIGTASMLAGMALGLGLPPILEQGFGLMATMSVFSGIAIVTTFVFWYVVPVSSSRNPQGTNSRIRLADMTALFRVRGFGLLCGAWCMAYGCFNGLTTWLEPLLSQHGITAVDAGVAGACLIGGGIVGALLLPYIFERMRARRIGLLFSCVAALGCLWPLCTATDQVALFSLAGMMGFLFLPGYPLILAESESLVGLERAGAATSMLMLVGNIGAVVFVVLMPLSNTSYSGWHNSIYLMLGAMLLSIALLIRANRRLA